MDSKRAEEKAQAKLLFSTCELEMKLFISPSLSHELNAMHLARLLVGINSLVGWGWGALLN